MNGKLSHSLSLRAGEWVQVRTKDEILSTLDDHGRLDELPFMPEMLRYCGKTFQVGKRAHKTCDPAMGIIGRKMASTVHLENLRCDGSAHDHCDARCLIFWKEAWLKRIGHEAKTAAALAENATSTGAVRCTEETLFSSLKVEPTAGDSEPTYMCQNTQVKFASQPIKWWNVRQYVEDYTSGNVTFGQLAGAGVYTVWRTLAEAGVGFGAAMRWSYDTFQRLIGGSPYPLRPYGVSDGVKTPKSLLDLNAGDCVRVRPFEEILQTLDSRYRNRGLYFDPDYVPFTERKYKVECRIRQIIDERNGKMIRFSSDAIVLENVVCEGKYAVCRRFCPRAIVPFWREIWLERVSEDQLDKDQGAQQPVISVDKQN
jgi:hypothetical protein